MDCLWPRIQCQMDSSTWGSLCNRTWQSQRGALLPCLYRLWCGLLFPREGEEICMAELGCLWWGFRNLRLTQQLPQRRFWQWPAKTSVLLSSCMTGRAAPVVLMRQGWLSVHGGIGHMILFHQPMQHLRNMKKERLTKLGSYNSVQSWFPLSCWPGLDSERRHMTDLLDDTSANCCELWGLLQKLHSERSIYRIFLPFFCICKQQHQFLCHFAWTTLKVRWTFIITMCYFKHIRLTVSFLQC